MARPIREKACDRCLSLSPVLYRVRLDASRQWQFVCDRCYPTVSINNPHYSYGGTWKAKKRNL